MLSAYTGTLFIYAETGIIHAFILFEVLKAGGLPEFRLFATADKSES